MRLFVLILCSVPVLSALSIGQQAPAHPKKILTPEQRAYQEQTGKVQEERATLRTQAKAAFGAEMAREKAGDCKGASTTYDFNVCYGKEIKISDQNLKIYEEAVRAILGLQYPKYPRQLTSGSAGAILTPEQNVAEFDHTEQLWHSYLDSACTAAFHQFDGGTGSPSFDMETHLRLIRSHMRELDIIYGEVLHL